MAGTNEYIEVKLEDWFNQIYESGHALKSFLVQEKIMQGQILSVEQGIELMKRINRMDEIRLSVSRLVSYVKTRPSMFTPKAHTLNQQLIQTLEEFDKHWVQPYEDQAQNSLTRYLTLRNNRNEQYAFMPPLKPDEELSREILIQKISSDELVTVGPKTKIRTLWKLAIAKIINKNNFQKEAWATTINKTFEFYNRVDLAVRKNVRDQAKLEHEKLQIQQEHFMRWLEIEERIFKVVEKSMNELSQNLDLNNNQKARFVIMMLRGAATGALMPLFMNGFLDPGIAVIDKIIQTILLRKGLVDINLDQNHVYTLTKFLPDANKKTYTNAYKKLLGETIYDKIDRYKHHLKHKMDALSRTRALIDLMTEESTIWNGHKPGEVIRALRMQIIDYSHFKNDELKALNPEKESDLIAAVSQPLTTMVTELFAPLESQYGEKEKLKGLHTLLNELEFNDSVAGPESHQHLREQSLIRNLSNHLEIHLIVKFLVEETEYFGGSSANRPLYGGKRDIRDDDTTFGLKPDDSCIRELIMALIKRIIRIDNDELKATLGLNPILSEADQIKDNLLIGWTIASTTHYNFRYYTRYFKKYRIINAEGDHQRRREMILAIIDQYYLCEITDLLQTELVKFSRYHGVDIKEPNQKPDRNGNFINPNWISDDSLQKMVEEKTKPFIDQTVLHKKMCFAYNDIGKCLLIKKQLIDDTARERAIEVSEKSIESSKARHTFNE